MNCWIDTFQTSWTPSDANLRRSELIIAEDNDEEGQ